MNQPVGGLALPSMSAPDGPVLPAVSVNPPDYFAISSGFQGSVVYSLDSLSFSSLLVFLAIAESSIALPVLREKDRFILNCSAKLTFDSSQTYAHSACPFTFQASSYFLGLFVPF